MGPFELNTIFGNVSGAACNSGDPIVLYDEQAERWLVAEFSVCDPNNYRMLIAVSQSADPTGRWHQYSFPMNGFPDYEKSGFGAMAIIWLPTHLRVMIFMCLSAIKCSLDKALSVFL